MDNVDNVDNVDKLELWVTRPLPRPKPRLRLFCLPYAGGGASVYRTWPQRLPPDIEVCPIQLPGRENRLLEPAFDRLAPLVQALARVLRPWQGVPFAFFGHSMGALIGFELARELRARGGPGPIHLFVSACCAPQLPDPNPAIHEYHEARLIEELRRLGGTPEAVLRNAELMQLLLPTLRADLAVSETYVYTNQGPLDCPISAFGGTFDNQVGEQYLTPWRDQTSSTFTLRMLPGNHFFLHEAGTHLCQAVTETLSDDCGKQL